MHRVVEGANPYRQEDDRRVMRREWHFNLGSSRTSTPTDEKNNGRGVRRKRRCDIGRPMVAPTNKEDIFSRNHIKIRRGELCSPEQNNEIICDLRRLSIFGCRGRRPRRPKTARRNLM